MPHTFPKRRFRPGEVADPDVLNEAFQDIVPKLAGRIGEQDISTDVKGKLAVADEAYYDAHQIVKGSNPDLTDAAAAGHPYATIDGDGGADPPATVEDSVSWQSLQDEGGTDVMALDIDCGEGDTLVMFAQAQHFAWKGTGPTDAADIDAPLKLQYAFEVDGAVVENSITGAAVWPDPPPQQWYRATPASNEFDYRHIQYLQNTLGIAHAAGASRILYATQIQSGSHTVALKARRLPMSDYKIDSAGDGTTVQVFNRRLFVLRIKGQSPRSDTGSQLVVDVFSDGDTLAATSITTNGFTKLATEVNDLDSGNIARGAFRSEHLPSMVYGPKAVAIYPAGPAADTFIGTYPGYGTNSAGWGIVNDGAGNDLSLTGPTAGQWDLSANPGTLVVLANVQVNYVKWTGASAPSTDTRALGVLALRMKNAAGTYTLLGETEVVINGHNFDNNFFLTDSAAIEIDVPLMWVVDSADLSALDKHIAQIDVVGCVWDGAAGTAPPDVEMGTQRGMLTAFVLKGVHLA